MDNIKNDKYYIDKIIQDLEFINQHMIDVDEEYKDKCTVVPWNALYGLRNRIVHDYGGVDLSIVYDTLIEDIPEMLNLVKDNII